MTTATPASLGATTVRVEVFMDDPTRSSRAAAQGATMSPDGAHDYQVSWGRYRQDGFVDPHGHVWLVGDTSPLCARYSVWLGGDKRAQAAPARAERMKTAPQVVLFGLLAVRSMAAS